MKFIIENLTKSYGKEYPIIENAGFTFNEGKIYGLLGRNGAGKTTLFNCISGDIPYNSGEFYFIEGADKKRKVEPEDIGYVLSTPTVPEFLTGREFVKFFLDINKDKVGNFISPDDYFDMVRLQEKDRDKLLKDYSHGMKNKIQMLVNIMANPKLFLLDEPLTSLDVVVSEEMKEMLRGFKENRVTIFSTHILDLAVDLCDEIVLLSRGALTKVEHTALDDSEFKNRIIELLKDEDDVDSSNDDNNNVDNNIGNNRNLSKNDANKVGAGWNV